MSRKKSTVSVLRNYRVQTVAEAKTIAAKWLDANDLRNVIGFGLPEVDDRYHIWRVPLRRLLRLPV